MGAETISNDQKERVLIIEGDEPVLEVMVRGFKLKGYLVTTALDGDKGASIAAANPPDLVIMDWILAGAQGLELSRQLRETGKFPILLLISKNVIDRNSQNIIHAADDYLVKPVRMNELLFRARYLLEKARNIKPAVLRFGSLSLDTISRRAVQGKRLIGLTAKEYDIFEMFMKNPRKVLSRESLFEEVWGYDFEGESNVLDVYIRYLRKKIEAGGESRVIQTIKGVGYVLRED